MIEFLHLTLLAASLHASAPTPTAATAMPRDPVLEAAHTLLTEAARTAIVDLPGEVGRALWRQHAQASELKR